MLVRIEEESTASLRNMARDWGVRNWTRISRPNLIESIAAAYRREVEAEERRVMHQRYVRRMRERVA